VNFKDHKYWIVNEFFFLLKNIASLRILHGFKLSLPGFVGDECLVVGLVVIAVALVVGFDV
jgi:hypothetical protein